MIKVLIVDDTVTTRQFLVKLLTQGGQIEVVGQASNGPAAIEMARTLKPDVITMDIVMPNMDGVEATARIMNSTPTPIVILSSVEDIRISALSMNALNSGALAVLAIPRADSPDLSALASHLRETVLAVAKVKSVRLEPQKKKTQMQVAAAADNGEVKGSANSNLKDILANRDNVEIFAMACSVGGPAALAKILGQLPASFPAPILITQHISRGFTEDLAAWLNQGSALDIKVARDFELLKPGKVYIAPDDNHLGLHDKSHIKISSLPPIKGFRPAASFMFESVARVYKSRAAVVILTGMGDDGLSGLKIQKEMGGIIIAQDEDSCIVYGMPKAAVNSGLADLILPLDAIAKNLVALAPSRKL